MSGLDIFAWIVLIILVASVIGVFCIAGWLPGHIAKTPRPSVGAGGNGRRLGHVDLRLCAVAGRADLGLCRRARLAWQGATIMMVAIMAVYLVLLFLLVRFGIVTFNLFWKVVAVHRAAAAQCSGCSSRWDGARRRGQCWSCAIRSRSCPTWPAR